MDVKPLKDAYFEHEADIGIIGIGTSINESFESAAKSMFAIMANPQEISKKQSIQVEFDEEDIELALVTWLNLLIAEARAKGLILSHFQLSHHGSHWTGEAWGEPWRDDLTRGTEVKGATLTMLSVKQINQHWEARCVVDV